MKWKIPNTDRGNNSHVFFSKNKFLLKEGETQGPHVWHFHGPRAHQCYLTALFGPPNWRPNWEASSVLPEGLPF